MEDGSTNVGRRILLRRGRGGGFSGGGFSSGISTRSESFDGSSDPEADEVDRAIDPEQVRDRIRSGALPPPGNPAPERDSPRSRLHDVATAGSSTYAKEYRLQLLHRMLMRNVPLDQIARQLQVSISTVEKDRVLLKARLREAATQMNIDEMVGTQQAVYDEISGMSMRIASQAGGGNDENGNAIQAVPTAMRLAAMRTALAANADRTRFLNTAGVFDVLKFRRAEDGTGLSDVQHLMQRTAELMRQLDESDDTPAPNPRRAGGFRPMTFDDVDASGSANEMQSL